MSLANRMWRTRPEDTQFDNLYEARDAARTQARTSAEMEFRFSELRPVVTDPSSFARYDNEPAKVAKGNVALAYQERGNEQLIEFSNWSFGQMAGLLGAPAAWLAERPAELLAAELLVDLRGKRADDTTQLYFIPQVDEKPGLLRAATTKYVRLTNERVFNTLLDLVAESNGDWMPAHLAPGNVVNDHGRVGRGKLGKALTLSDRDGWAFLVNPNKPVYGQNEGDVLFPGIAVHNSEVGSANIDFESFLFRSLCTNRSILGLSGTESWSGRHVGRINERYEAELVPALRALAKAPVDGLQTIITRSRTKEVADSLKGVMAYLKDAGFGTIESRAAYSLAEQEGLNPRSVYGLVQGLTAQYRDLKHQNTRVEREEKASRLYRLVGAN